MSDLERMFTNFGTDKGTWGYTPVYEEHLGPRRESVKKVLEIGICGYRDIPYNVVGASLFAWRDYFPNARIYGLDSDPRFIFNDCARIYTHMADAYCQPDLSHALRALGVDKGEQFDFICDDAVHDPLPQINLALMLWPLLKTGGIYAIEDVCPYKVMNNDLIHMIQPLIIAHPEMRINEYTTHKAERLLILHKDPKPQVD